MPVVQVIKRNKSIELTNKILPTENFIDCISSNKTKLYSIECKQVSNYYCEKLVKHFPENTPISLYIRCKSFINNEE